MCTFFMGAKTTTITMMFGKKSRLIDRPVMGF